MLIRLTAFATVLTVLSARATPLHHPARRPVIVIGVDGLSARACGASSGFASILANSSYTLRARSKEYTRSYEGWQANLMGGYDTDNNYEAGPRHPPLFTYIKSQMPDAVLWHIGRYYIVRLAINYTAADFYLRTLTATKTADAFVENVDVRKPPDLAVLYFRDADDAGHGKGWDSQHYKNTVENVAVQIQRIHFALPNALIFVISDHGGRGSGHIYSGRDMRALATDIDSPWHRDVPWIRYVDTHPRPLCDTIHTDETAAEIARALGIKAHPSWRTRVGWLPSDFPCSHDDVSSRVVASGTSDISSNSTLMLWALTAVFFFVLDAI